MPGQVEAGRAFVRFSVNDEELKKGMRKIQVRMRSFGNSLKNVGDVFAKFGAAATAPFIATIKVASDAQESLSRFGAIFGEQTEAASKFAETLSKEVGRSALDLKDSLATFQGFFVGLGLAGDEAQALSEKMSRLAIDFASFNNLSDAEAQQRFISALSGSSEVLDKFGVNIRVAALQQEALRRGMNKSVSQMTELEKATLRLSIIEKVMGDQGAIGDAVRTSGSFQNQLKRLTGNIKDISAEIGTTLLPLATDFLQIIGGLVKSIGDWAKENTAMVAGLAKAAAGMLAFGSAASIAGRAVILLSGAVGALNKTFVVLLAHPFVAVAALWGTAVVGLTTHFLTAKDAVDRFKESLLDLQVERVNLESIEQAEKLLETLLAKREALRKEVAKSKADPFSGLAAVFGGGTVTNKELNQLEAEIERVVGKLAVLRGNQDGAVKAADELATISRKDTGKPDAIGDFLRNLPFQIAANRLRDLRDEFGNLIDDFSGSKTLQKIGNFGDFLADSLSPDIRKLDVGALGGVLPGLAGGGPGGILTGILQDQLTRGFDVARQQAQSVGTFNPFVAANIQRAGSPQERQLEEVNDSILNGNRILTDIRRNMGGFFI